MPRPVAERPYKSPTGNIQVVALVSEGLRETVLAEARQRGMSMSTLVRQAVMAYLGADVDGQPARKSRRERAS